MNEGFSVRMSASFLLRLQRLICFSRSMAVSGSSNSSLNQTLDSLLFGETVDHFVLVLIPPAFQLRPNADVQNSAAAREDIDVKLAADGRAIPPLRSG